MWHSTLNVRNHCLVLQYWFSILARSSSSKCWLLFFHPHPPLGSVGLEKASSCFHHTCDLVYNMYARLINLCVCATYEYHCYSCAWRLGSKAMASRSQKQGCCLPELYLLSVNHGNHLRVSCERGPPVGGCWATSVLASRNTAERKQEEAATGQDSTQEIKVPFLFRQL